MIRILVIDDHEMIRMGLSGILSAQPDLLVCGAAADGSSGVSLAESELPDVVLMDLSMPGIDGIEATRRIMAQSPEARVLMLTWHSDGASVRAAMDAGACGYLLKEATPDALIEAVRAAHRGERPLAEAAEEALGAS